MKTAAYIPIKLNNQRLPGKNLLPLGDRPLCGHIFSTLASVEGIDERYVFCSDESIYEHLPESITFLKRSPLLDRDETSTMEIIGSFMEKVDADVYVLTHVTSPFLKQASIETALEKVKNEGYDSAFCVERIQSLCWFRSEPLNYSINRIPRTQEIDPVLVETNGFYIFKKEVAKSGSRIGRNPYICEVDKVEAIDIDTIEDYGYAEHIVRMGE